MPPTPDAIAYSFIIPLYQTGDGLTALLDGMRSLKLSKPWELVLVDDGSTDGSFQKAQILTYDFPCPIVLVELARNYGEHASVLEGYRQASGRLMVNLDDDLQNPPEEALRLLQHLEQSSAEVIYAQFDQKKHSAIRNLGSWLINKAATALLGKPQHLYLSSFRAIRRELAERIITSRSPFPHIDGLILGATRRIGTLTVRHEERRHGQSSYTARKLIRLGMSLMFDFSIMPLRFASLLGITLCLLGGGTLVSVIYEMFMYGLKQPGWGSLMSALAVFSGTQLLMLGIIGEYVGRTFLTVSGRPQTHVRTLITQAPNLTKDLGGPTHQPA